MKKNESIEVLKKWAAWNLRCHANEEDSEAAKAVLDLIAYVGTLESRLKVQEAFSSSHPPVAIL